MKIFIAFSALIWGIIYMSVLPLEAQPRPDFVLDEGRLLKPTDITQIEQLLNGLYNELGYDFRFVSVDSLEGRTVAEFGSSKARDIGIRGQGYNISGMILVSSKEKRLILELSPALEWVVPESESSYIKREIINSFRSGDYAQGIIDAFMRLNFLADQKSWSIDYDNYDDFIHHLSSAEDKIVRINASVVTRRFADEKLTDEQFADSYFIYLRGPDQKPVKLRFSKNSLDLIRDLMSTGKGFVYGQVVKANPLDINFLGWEQDQ